MSKAPVRLTLSAKGRAKLAEMASHPRFGDIYKVEWFDNRPDERRWMFINATSMSASGPFAMMVVDGTFAGTMTHWDSLNGFVRVEE